MKIFNKNIEYKKLKLKQNKGTYIKRLSISLSCLILVCVLILFTFAKFESNSNEYTLIHARLAGLFGDLVLNKYYVDNVSTNTIPEKNTGYSFDRVECDNATATWDNTDWSLFVPITQITKCSLYFNKEYEWTFNYKTSAQVFKVPFTGIYKIELWGAKGSSDDGYLGGYGAYTSGNISLTANQKLYIYTGQSGVYTGGGFNGGGTGRLNDTSGYRYGGGATDVRYFGSDTPSSTLLTWNNATSLNSRIMVAAGGGGGALANGTVSGAYVSADGTGNAGGLTGYKGSVSTSYPNNYANGGKQNAGGSVTNYSSSYTAGTAGTFGVGGNGGGAKTNSNGYSTGSFGGGAGYYGGAGGSRWAAATTNGGGGSSYISGHAGCLAIKEGNTSNPRTLKDGCSATSTSVDCSIHYSGLSFTNTVMIDGSGYSWTTEKSSEVVGMPTHDGTGSTTGHEGNGYAKITLISES